MRIKKDDTVIVLAGKDKGKTGKAVSYTHLDVYKRQSPDNALNRSTGLIKQELERQNKAVQKIFLKK